MATITGGWLQTHRFTGLPALPGAGTDVVAGAPVSIVAGGSQWGVTPCGSSNVLPLGVARASAPVGQAVTVWDVADIHQAVCLNAGSISGPSIAAGDYVGVASVTTVEPTTGTKVRVPLIGKVSAASGSLVCAIGQAIEGALPGQTFGYYLKPQQISSKGWALGE